MNGGSLCCGIFIFHLFSILHYILQVPYITLYYNFHNQKKKKRKAKTQVAQGLNWLPSPPKPVALVQVAPYNRMKKILQREHKVRQTDKVKWPQSVCRRTYQSAARGVMTSKRLLFSFLRIFSQQEVRTVVGRRGGCPQGKGSFGSC